MKNYDSNSPHIVWLTYTGELLYSQESDGLSGLLNVFRGSFEQCNEFCKLNTVAEGAIKFHLDSFVSVGDQEKAISAKKMFDDMEKKRAYLQVLYDACIQKRTLA